MSSGVLLDLPTAVRDVRGLTDAELHEELQAADLQRRRAEVREVEVLAEIDVRRSFDPLGAKSTATFAAWVLPIPEDTARALVRCSRQVRRMHLVADAFRRGQITVTHVRLLASCEHTNPDAFAAAEQFLLGLALKFDVKDFTGLVTYWRNAADPDGSLEDAEKKYLARSGSVIVAPDGMVLVRAQMDPISGGKFLTLFDRVARELFVKDWEAAKAVHGDSVCSELLARTDAQRGNDALEIIAERAIEHAGDLTDIHGPRPLITVLVGEETLANLCESEGGTILDPHDLLRLLDTAEVERVVFDGPSRVLDVGVRQRFFTGATRRAVQVHDRECAHPSCHAPVTDADIDHILEFADDGLTVQENGRVLCRWHHRWRHRMDRRTEPAA